MTASLSGDSGCDGPIVAGVYREKNERKERRKKREEMKLGCRSPMWKKEREERRSRYREEKKEREHPANLRFSSKLETLKCQQQIETQRQVVKQVVG